MHTPGHTPEHISFLSPIWRRRNRADGNRQRRFYFRRQWAGRICWKRRRAKWGERKSAQVLHQSIQRFSSCLIICKFGRRTAREALAARLWARCRNPPSVTRNVSTPRFKRPTTKAFVESILYGQPEPPLYFARMKRDNKEGPALLGEMPAPKPMTADDLKAMPSATR
jgi:hydroxyacylglutathione hydrolase